MQNFTPISEFINTNNFPLIISGPCSAENRKQLISTAEAINATGKVHLFRAGLWKPRTRPGDFEGVGEKGFDWLNEVKEKTGLAVAVEVATPKHLELCLKNNIDVLWIGSRTVVNPFSITELAKSLKGVDIPVMIKNPINPELDLWIGAIERIYNSGINKIIAIHRGFFTFDKTIFRNDPVWHIPFELKRRYPKLPIVCDSSHICGKTELIPEISQKAIDFEMDGLMIESHINPKNALTDSRQQLNPFQLKDLLDSLVIKHTGGEVHKKILNQLREEVDNADDQMLKYLSHRQEIIYQMGQYKYEHNITILQLDRWNNVLEKRLSKGESLEINKDFLFKLLQIIHDESIRIQSDISKKKEKEKQQQVKASL